MSPAKKTAPAKKKAPAAKAPFAVKKDSARPGATPTGDLPIVFFADAKSFDTWLAKHHATSSGAWLKLSKKGATVTSLSYNEAVELALIWGWIDSQKGRFDETAYILKFTPRGPRSIWSKINRDKATALIAEGRVKPSGLAEIENAKKNGRWDAAYDSQSKATIPEDLAQALAANPRAEAFFATLNSVNRYAVLFRIHNVKKAETRARKITQYVDMLARHEKLHD
ncbi:YdeI/OmpD-associated family protein [Myxococcus landrumensis]|uniref:YdeI/OmpD-associated family protein n=1 Tax=Myxococcus landrumensis TaxID=2813577 RepID=A0ABX7N1N9_9BACT|nr:YdeI/OmpD-associated family protein [Myxococcus landrumus]QSQ12626.1 YdeI/OmpD-associated family protein [Myxococcus landrumus]